MLRSRFASLVLSLLLLAAAVQAEDLHLKKNISVGGNVVSSSEVSVKGSRERDVTQSPSGDVVTIRQCDLKRTLTLNAQSQTYLVANDPQDDSAAAAAALITGAPAADSGGKITVSSMVTDTGERKSILGYQARHLKTTVLEQSSSNACTQVNQKFEIDGWYADLSKDQAGCQQAIPPVRLSEGCHDRVVIHRAGTGKPGYPLSENITIHGADGSSTVVAVQVADLSKQPLAEDLFDVPSGYRQVNSAAEMNAPAPATAVASAQTQPPASFDPSGALRQAMTSGNAAAANALAQQAAWKSAGQMGFTGEMQGMGGSQPGSTPIAAPQALGPKAAGKIRIGVAPPDAQVGQGNNAGGDYSTPIRNSIVLLMNGPAIEIAALDSHIAMQLQAEAQQKQCDYILYSSVAVKHSASGGFGKFMKMAAPVASMVPMAGMGSGMGGAMAAQAAGAAASAAAMSAQQQAMNQLAGFNGQIKQKDDVTVAYQLFPAGQDKAVLENSLKAKAKSDGEDVLTPLIQQTASAVLTQVSKK